MLSSSLSSKPSSLDGVRGKCILLPSHNEDHIEALIIFSFSFLCSNIVCDCLAIFQSNINMYGGQRFVSENVILYYIHISETNYCQVNFLRILLLEFKFCGIKLKIIIFANFLNFAVPRYQLCKEIF